MADRSDWTELMASAQAGNAVAYRTLLSTISPYLKSLAWRAGMEGSDGEDMVQDILLTVHTIRHTYDPARPFGPWLVAVAKHRIVDKLRQRGRTLGREVSFSDEHETFGSDEANLHEQASESRRLRAAIADLPVGQRQAVELLKIKELSLKEASAQSGQSETALKVAVHRAIKRLRVLLGGDEP